MKLYFLYGMESAKQLVGTNANAELRTQISMSNLGANNTARAMDMHCFMDSFTQVLLTLSHGKRMHIINFITYTI
jgi:hypothetical protein